MFNFYRDTQKKYDAISKRELRTDEEVAELVAFTKIVNSAFFQKNTAEKVLQTLSSAQKNSSGGKTGENEEKKDGAEARPDGQGGANQVSLGADFDEAKLGSLLHERKELKKYWTIGPLAALNLNLIH